MLDPYNSVFVLKVKYYVVKAKKTKVHQSEWSVSWEISVFLFIMGLVLSIQMPGFLEGQSKCKRKHPSKKEGTSSKKK